MGLTEHGPITLTPGPWWTIESLYGSIPSTKWVFRSPAGLHIKVRYGYAAFGWDRQRQLTDGVNDKTLSVNGVVAVARIQVGVHQELTFTWTRITEGP